jgi:hypothetical protein
MQNGGAYCQVFLRVHMFNNPLISGWIQDIKTAKEKQWPKVYTTALPP